MENWIFWVWHERYYVFSIRNSIFFNWIIRTQKKINKNKKKTKQVERKAERDKASGNKIRWEWSWSGGKIGLSIYISDWLISKPNIYDTEKKIHCFGFFLLSNNSLHKDWTFYFWKHLIWISINIKKSWKCHFHRKFSSNIFSWGDFVGF